MLFLRDKAKVELTDPAVFRELFASLADRDEVIQRMQTVGLPTDEQIKTWVKGRITPRVLTHV